MKSLVQGRKVLSVLVLGGFALIQFNTAGAVGMNVVAEVADFCEMGTTTDVDFLTLTPGAGVDGSAAGTVEWRCSSGTNADLHIDAGGNGNRTMDNLATADTLAYELYQDALHTTVWDDGGSQYSVVGLGLAAGFVVENVYGLVLSADIDGADTGQYADSVDVDFTIIP